MRWPRWTTRRIMASAALLAVALGLGLPAVAALGDRPHRHTWYVLPANEPKLPSVCHYAFRCSRFVHPAPFAARYWRHLRGEPRAVCRAPLKYAKEACHLRPPP